MTNSEVAGPIFVVGMNGSGTTMLADCIGRHSELFMFPGETRVLPYFLKNLAQFGDLSTTENCLDMANQILATRAYWQNNNERRIRLSIDQINGTGVSGVLDTVYGQFDQTNKKRWGDKTPMYVQHIPLIAQHLPSAKFIHIIRDGRDVAQSFHRRWAKSPERTIYRWKRVVELGRKDGKLLGDKKYMEISYEELTEVPEIVMKKICEFLKVEFQQDILLSSMPYFNNVSRNNSDGGIQRNSDKWKNYFSDSQIAKLESISGRALSEFGYHIRTNEGDKNPSSALLYLWHQKDNLNSVVRFLQRNGVKSANVLLKRIKESRMQNRTNQY